MFLRRQFLLALAAASFVASTNPALYADDPSIKPTAAEPFTPSPEFQTLITRLAREQLPDKYEKTKNWGKTSRVFDGWKLERDGLRLETRRRFKQANDGAWQKYTIELLDPDQNFELRVTNLRQQESQVVCDVAVIASARVHGRHTQWENGVQLLSIGAVADARLQLRAQLAMSMKLDPTKFPPDISLEPRVTQADLDILDFKIQRISHFGGPVVKSLSSSVREVLEDKIAESRPQLVARLNKSLAKQDAKLRFSAVDFLSALKSQALATPPR
ncbi:MAG: hypothetical protein K8R36_03560 [Planctomycetales bacterium]|nr:hypothetical protein [Planctomycetales bacterium]